MPHADIRSRALRALALALAVATSIATLNAQESGIPVGSMAPAAMVETLDGALVDLAAYLKQGKPVVLEFWATWCPLCRQLEPAMQAARTKYAGQVTFVSVGVSSNQSPARQKAHAEANGIGGEFVFDRHDAAQKAYMVPHTSFLVVIDRTGRIVYTGQGGTQDVEAAIRKGVLP
jgi:thiol-disulfide isomerase/thioredoxin